MDTLRSPAALASLVARHVVPVVGVLLLGWPAGNVLLLLGLDTLLALTGLMLLVMIHVTGLDDRGGPGPVRWPRLVAAFPIALALCALPVGFTLAWIMAGMRWNEAALAAPDLQAGLAVQLVASATAFLQLHRRLVVRNDDQRILSRALLFVVARWTVLCIAALPGIAAWLGPRLGGAVLLLVYAAASVWFELFPSHAARFVRGARAKPIEQVIAEDLAAEARRRAKGRGR
jgi:hypothetical protein